MAHATTDEAPQPAVEEAWSARTLAALWRRATSETRTAPAYLAETNDGWKEVSWQEAARRVDELAHGLLDLGVRRGDRFAILARTSLEWSLLDFALISIGAVVVPIYPTSADAEATYILRHSESVGVAAEDAAHLSRVAGRPEDVPDLRHRLAFADLDALAESGRAHAAAHPGAVATIAAAIDEDDLLTCMYTSGTTGPPKGCLLRHRNYYVMTTVIEEIPGLGLQDDRLLLFLPLAHTFARLMHFWGARAGFTIAFCADPQRVSEALAAVRPTLLPSVPRVFEKVHTAVAAQFEAATGVKRRLVDWALSVGRRVSRLRQQGRSLPPGLAAQHRLADRLVYSKIKEKLGGNLRYAISGGAPLSREVAEFFHALDVLILEGYGQTEGTTACTVNLPDRFRFGTVGPAMPRIEVKTADDGEVLVRGEILFAGYLKDEDATRAVLTEDGWLKTGDVGVIDADGFLAITDRKKDLLITAGGKNVAPQNIENQLKASKYVSQALAVGDRKPYIAALITLDEEEVRKAMPGSDGDAASLAAAHEIRVRIGELVEAVNARLSRHEQVKRFAILPRDFSAEEGEITPTLKLKRRVCEQHFAEDIAELYR